MVKKCLHYLKLINGNTFWAKFFWNKKTNTTKMLNCCYIRRFVHNIVLDSVVHRSACRSNQNQRNQMISPTQLNHPLQLQHERAPTVHTCEEDRDQLISPQHRTQPSLQSHRMLPIVTTTRSLTKFFNAENSGAHHRRRRLRQLL